MNRNLGKAMVLAAGLAAAFTAGACEPGAAAGRSQADALRGSAMRSIHADNRVALQRDLRQAQTALLDQTRQAFLATRSGSNTTARAAP